MNSKNDAGIGPVQSKAPPTLKERLYEIIFEAHTFAGKFFDVILIIAILASVTAVCLETIDVMKVRYGDWLLRLEWFFTIIFTIEYGLRLYCVKNRVAYAFSFYGIVDLLSILPSYAGLMLGGSASFAVVRSFRLLRVFRVMKLIHLSGEAEDLGAAIWKARGKVVVFLAFVVIVVTVSGALMYEIEHFGDKESQFTSIPQAIYWAIVTMTTVGYGDIVPHTTLGKIVSACLILIGYSLIIVPTGFVSAEIISARRTPMRLTETCPNCMVEGHELDSAYCRRCGHKLNP